MLEIVAAVAVCASVEEPAASYWRALIDRWAAAASRSPAPLLGKVHGHVRFS